MIVVRMPSRDGTNRPARLLNGIGHTMMVLVCVCVCECGGGGGGGRATVRGGPINNWFDDTIVGRICR